MLELKGIKKDYKLKDQEPVHALKGISLNFRKNEFVTILGHSGCGKTTLLNIIGGLDHYDEGDLLIKGISTKNYTDRDWDTYRNHSIGFVFQSYNLIPHQNILKNVELALTISGIEKEERNRRAKEALDLVGLKGLYNKKPNQLSGGQMQRVAIARALVNNPEIVLADEPTGALDSETSLQIMDILKDVSKNHLVIMVSHNPELADKYSSRIVRMKDGEIMSDSNPFDGKEEIVVEKENVVNKGNKKQSSMSFFTATKLSISNLFSKFKRTLLVSIAGSIGIIGVSTILGVSCGVNEYIYDMEDDMLSSYPIGVAEESMDMTSLLTGLQNSNGEDVRKFDTSTRVGLDSMIEFLMTKYSDFTNVKTNDINDDLVEYIAEMPTDYYSALTYNYGIDPTNNIFTAFKEKKDQTTPADIISINGLTQRYISTLMTVNGFGDYAQFVNLFTNFMKQMPDSEEYILSQYDLLGDSKFATADNEIMVVVDQDTTMTDLMLAQMGYYPQDEFLNIAKKAVLTKEQYQKYLDGEITYEQYLVKAKEIAETYKYDDSFAYENILNHDFYYYPNDAIYMENPLFVSRSTGELTLSGTDADGNRYFVTLSFVDRSTAQSMVGLLMPGLKIDNDVLYGKCIIVDSLNQINQQSVDSYFVLKRVGERDKNKTVMDGTWSQLLSFGETKKLTLASTNPSGTGTTISYELDPSTTFGIYKSNGDLKTAINIDSGIIKETTPETPDFYYEAYKEAEGSPIKGKDVTEVPNAKKMKVVGILRPKSNTNFGTLSRGIYYTKAFATKYMNDAATSHIVEEYKDHIINERFNSSTFNAYVHYKYDDWSEDDGDPAFEPSVNYDGYASALNDEFSSSLASMFLSSFLGSGGNVDTEKTHLRAISGLKIVEKYNADTKVTTYSIAHLPKSISIYPKDFARKDQVTSYLDVWNSEQDITLKTGKVITSDDENRSELTYTDSISLIVVAISTLITVVSASLIAFTSLSLVVSCFMIAVITYISVMERVKEIGIIRSLGGRKKDVSRLFVAENLITGLASGVIGILITLILEIIINAIVMPLGAPAIAALPWYYALMMIGISVLLSVLSGAIPSMSASKQDPVIALRTE